MLEPFDSDIQFGSHGNYFDFFSKGIALQTIHVCQVILNMLEGMGLTWDFLNAVNSGIDHRNIQCSALTLTSKLALAKI